MMSDTRRLRLLATLNRRRGSARRPRPRRLVARCATGAANFL